MTRTLAVVVSLLAALVSVPVVSAPALAARAERDSATTARGGAAGTRTVIVRRGVNVVDKSGWSGGLADPMLTRDAVRELAALGFTTLRLGFTWDSLQHRRDRLDRRYLTQLERQLDLLHDFGMTAVIDMHQDTWSARLGSDGAPEWADPQCRQPPDADLDDLTGVFFLEYLSPAVSAAFANFYHDGFGATDPFCTGRVLSDFVRTWRGIARTLRGHPAVVGYDLLNEPWVAGAPGVFERTTLSSFYRRVTRAIRSVDPHTPIYFEPVAVYQVAVPFTGTSPDRKAVFAPHVYTEREAESPITTEGQSEQISLDKAVSDAFALGAGLWIGEWGNTTDVDFISQFYDLLDQRGLGGAFWAQVQAPGDRFPRALFAAHTRPYVERHRGNVTWSWDRTSRTFRVRVEQPRAGTTVGLVVPRRLGLRPTGGTRRRGLTFTGGGRTTCPARVQRVCRATWRITRREARKDVLVLTLRATGGLS